jgi:hypothetical protein
MLGSSSATDGSQHIVGMGDGNSALKRCGRLQFGAAIMHPCHAHAHLNFKESKSHITDTILI